MPNIDPKRSREVLERVERERGSARAWPKLLAAHDPDMLELLHETTTHVLERRNAIPRKYKELILVCLNAVALREFGVRFHARGAIQHGATEDEIVEALEIVGIINQHGLTSMLQPVSEEVEKLRSTASSADLSKPQ